MIAKVNNPNNLSKLIVENDKKQCQNVVMVP